VQLCRVKPMYAHRVEAEGAAAAGLCLCMLMQVENRNVDCMLTLLRLSGQGQPGMLEGISPA
jgi:hypothetical protein